METLKQTTTTYWVFGGWNEDGEDDYLDYGTIEEARKVFHEIIDEQKNAEEPYDYIKLYMTICDTDGDELVKKDIEQWDAEEQLINEHWKKTMALRAEQRELLESIGASIPDDLKHISFDEWKIKYVF